ncbi:hypothetical protein [Sulfitobacter sp.]|jgi:hypothetical protein|uniref:hypothetical protein n=1 Tax=Sulfitobacter sp. TaxID=1903071 RepID=UPI003EF78F30
MPPYISVVRTSPRDATTQCATFLVAAAKIVETVAFEIAMDNPPEKIERLLALACAIEKETAELSLRG